MLEKMKELENRDASLRETKKKTPASAKVLKRSQTLEPKTNTHTDNTKKEEKKQAKKDVTKKVIEKKALARSKTLDQKVAKPQLKKQATVADGKNLQKKARARAASESRESVRSDGSKSESESHSNNQASAQEAPKPPRAPSQKRREINPLDAIPQVEKFHRKPRTHTEPAESIAKRLASVKKRQPKPKPTKTEEEPVAPAEHNQPHPPQQAVHFEQEEPQLPLVQTPAKQIRDSTAKKTQKLSQSHAHSNALESAGAGFMSHLKESDSEEEPPAVVVKKEQTPQRVEKTPAKPQTSAAKSEHKTHTPVAKVKSPENSPVIYAPVQNDMDTEELPRLPIQPLQAQSTLLEEPVVDEQPEFAPEFAVPNEEPLPKLASPLKTATPQKLPTPVKQPTPAKTQSPAKQQTPPKPSFATTFDSMVEEELPNQADLAAETALEPDIVHHQPSYPTPKKDPTPKKEDPIKKDPTPSPTPKKDPTPKKEEARAQSIAKQEPAVLSNLVGYETSSDEAPQDIEESRMQEEELQPHGLSQELAAEPAQEQEPDEVQRASNKSETSMEPIRESQEDSNESSVKQAGEQHETHSQEDLHDSNPLQLEPLNKGPASLHQGYSRLEPQDGTNLDTLQHELQTGSQNPTPLKSAALQPEPEPNAPSESKLDDSGTMFF